MIPLEIPYPQPLPCLFSVIAQCPQYLCMDDIILVVGNAEEVRKRIKNCRKMETVKKSEYGAKKSKIMVVRNVKEEVEQIDMKEHSRKCWSMVSPH